MRRGELQFLPVDLDRHAELCLSFRVDSFVVSFGDADLLGDPEVYLRLLARRSASWPGSIVHVWQEGQIIGQLELRRSRTDEQEGYINLFYLVPDRRGVGLGDRLHHYALDFLRAGGLLRAALSVSPTNHRARRYYARHGWQDLGPDSERGGRVHRLVRAL